MATTFWLSDTDEAGITTADGYLEQELATAEIGGSTKEGKATATASGNHIEVLDGLSGTKSMWLIRVNAFTCSGSVTFNFYGRESAMTVNAGFAARVVRVGNDGTIISDVVAQGNANHADGVELGTSDALMSWTATPTNTSFSDGDWIGVIAHADAVGTMAAGTVTLNYNGTSTALTASRITFAETITEFVGNNVSPGILGGYSIFSPRIDLAAAPAVLGGFSILAPSVVANVNPGVLGGGLIFAPQRLDLTAHPDILGGGAIFAPRVDQRVDLALITQAGVVFAFQRIDTTVGPPVIGGGTVFEVGRIDQTAHPGVLGGGQTFSPSIIFSVTPGLIGPTGQVFALARVDQNINPGVLGGGQTFSPQVDLNVALGLIQQLATAHAPQVNLSLAPGVLGGGQTFAPTLDAGSSVIPALIGPTGQVFALVRIDETVNPGVLGGAQVFSLDVSSGSAVETALASFLTLGVGK